MNRNCIKCRDYLSDESQSVIIGEYDCICTFCYGTAAMENLALKPKECRRCGQMKPTCEFPFPKRGESNNFCKACKCAKAKESQKRNRIKSTGAMSWRDMNRLNPRGSNET